MMTHSADLERIWIDQQAKDQALMNRLNLASKSRLAQQRQNERIEHEDTEEV